MKKSLLPFLLLLLLSDAGKAQTLCNPQFTWNPAPTTGNSLTIAFVNTSVFPNPSPSLMPNCWIRFGDNTQLNSFFGSTTHTYAAPGTYTVRMYISTYDSLSQQQLCIDSITQQVTVNYPCSSSLNFQNQGSGLFSFNVYTPPPYSSIPGQPSSPTWNFGDNSPAATGYNVSHTYAASGLYTVTVTLPTCLYPYITYVSYIDSTLSCDSMSADFNYNNNNGIGTTVSFYNTSVFSPSSPVQNIPLSSTVQWYFGDGGSSAQQNPVHTYNAAGIYDVLLISSWYDSLTQNLICADSMVQQVAAGNANPLNVISGAVLWDSLNAAPPAGFRVWLITHDSVNNELWAIDSTDINPWGDLYSFWNAAAGNYLVKAAALNQPAGQGGWLPTYHDSSLYWSGAATIIHTGGFTEQKNIHMQTGIVAPGPGFIGGNISQGAGKGTGTGVEGMLVFLRAADGKVVAATYTGDGGDYSFTNIAQGTYSIYPEAINYLTIPAAQLLVQEGHYTWPAVDFEQTEDEIHPKTTGMIPVTTAENKTLVYPNPAGDRLFIRNTGDGYNKAALLDITGRTVLAQVLRNGTNSLQLTSIGAGIYYLVLSGHTGRQTLKVIRQ